MKQSSYFITKMMISLLILIAHSDLVAQTSDSESGTAAIDMQEARATIESIVKQFSDDYRNGDSLAVAAHYAKDAQFGSLKGDEILAYWGRSIRKSIKMIHKT